MNYGKVIGKLMTYYGIIITLSGGKFISFIIGMLLVTVGCFWHELTE